jgi:hypothetical protein
MKENKESKKVNILTEIGHSFRTDRTTLMPKRQIQALYPISGDKM